MLALPALYMGYGYVRGTMFYGEFLHATGELGAQLLIVTMAVTPLRLAFPHAGWTRWLLPRRRYLGVAAFGYACMHAAAYVHRLADLERIAADAAGVAMWTGWLALIVMLALAATSNNASVRLLRHTWKWLHRSVYAVAVLTFAHWVLTAFDPVRGWIHVAVLLALEAYRLWHTALNPRRTRPIREPAR